MLGLLVVVALVGQGCSPKGASRQGVDDVRLAALTELLLNHGSLFAGDNPGTIFVAILDKKGEFNSPPDELMTCLAADVGVRWKIASYTGPAVPRRPQPPSEASSPNTTAADSWPIAWVYVHDPLDQREVRVTIGRCGSPGYGFSGLQYNGSFIRKGKLWFPTGFEAALVHGRQF